MACFLRELVILNECEGSQNRVKERCFALLSMTNNIWVNCYIVAKVKLVLMARRLSPLRRLQVDVNLCEWVFVVFGVVAIRL